MYYNISLILIFCAIITFAYWSAYNDGSTSQSSTLENNLNASEASIRLMDAALVTVGIEDSRMVTDYEERNITNLPGSANVWNSAIQVRDQGPWGSCTAFSTRYAYLIHQLKDGPLIEPSTSFWYAKARALNPGIPLRDTGTTLTAMMTVLQSQGTLSETQWPYSGSNIFTPPTIIPNANSQLEVIKRLRITNSSANNLVTLKTALANGNPVVISIRVYSSFMTNNVFVTGIVPSPSKKDRLLGGHAICLIGYNDIYQRFYFYNSWGTYTGINGYFTIPYGYVSNPNYAGEYYSFES
jgi:C1A family cysteine protease